METTTEKDPIEVQALLQFAEASINMMYLHDAHVYKITDAEDPDTNMLIAELSFACPCPKCEGEPLMVGDIDECGAETLVCPSCELHYILTHPAKKGELFRMSFMIPFWPSEQVGYAGAVGGKVAAAVQ
jgi:hypothetical protein